MRRVLPPLSVFAATVLAFLPALKGGFVNWDDTVGLAQNPAFRGLSPSHLAWMLTAGLLGHYQPLAWLSFALDFKLWGLDPFGYHLTAVLLHGLNAVLLYRVALLIYERAGVEDGRRVWGAALAALLFSLHPLRVESVAWATERRDLLHGGFLLLATWAYLKTAYAASFAAFTGAMLSKVTAAAWPFGLLALDLYPLKRSSWKDKAGYLLPVALVLPLALRAQRETGSLVTLEQSGPLWRLGQAVFSVAWYPWKTLAPTGLAAWYEKPYLREHLWVLVLGGLLLLATPLAYKKKPLFAAWLFYLLMLFPMSGIVKSGGQVVADRYSYVPLMGLAVLAGGWATSRKKALWAGAAVLPVLAALTWAQCGVWRDSVTLWTRAAEVNPGSFFAQMNAAQGLQERGLHEEAVAALEAVLARHPEHPQGETVLAIVVNNWGLALLEAGRPEEAVTRLERACALAPENAAFRTNLALARAAAASSRRSPRR